MRFIVSLIILVDLILKKLVFKCWWTLKLFALFKSKLVYFKSLKSTTFAVKKLIEARHHRGTWFGQKSKVWIIYFLDEEALFSKERKKMRDQLILKRFTRSCDLTNNCGLKNVEREKERKREREKERREKERKREKKKEKEW